MKHPKIVTAVLTTAILLVLVILSGFVVVYSGSFNVAASKPEGSLTSWVLGTTMEQSVRRQASGVSLDLSRADLGEGAEHYAAMCATCHGGPGDEPPSVIGQGLNPAPADLRKSASRWKAGEIYWILDNGIKMTGMPAFGKTHSPEQLTNMAAFVEKRPTTTVQEHQRPRDTMPATNRPSGTGPEHHDHD